MGCQCSGRQQRGSRSCNMNSFQNMCPSMGSSQGSQGPQGPPGPEGKQGPPGLNGTGLLSVSTIVPQDGKTELFINPNSDMVLVDTTNFDALLFLGPPSGPHVITVRLMSQTGYDATIRTSSGGSVLLTSDNPDVMLFYNNGTWQIIGGTAGTSFIPNSTNVVKLTPVGNVGAAEFSQIAVSSDGSTLAIGGTGDNGHIGAVWIYTKVNGVWTQQGIKLVGTGATGPAGQGVVALSGDGNTLVVGAPNDNSGAGAVWVWTRSGGVWIQQGNKIVGSGASGLAHQGTAVALSGNGSVLAVGGPTDAGNNGAVWMYVRSGGVWMQQGAKLTGGGTNVGSHFGTALSLSSLGDTLAVAAPNDNANNGSIVIFKNMAGVWVQQGSKLLATGNIGAQLSSVALSSNGRSLVVGGSQDNTSSGGIWVFNESEGVWTQQGEKLTVTGNAGSAEVGTAVSMSADGNTIIATGPGDASGAGATWIFRRNSQGNWVQYGNKLVGQGGIGSSDQGSSVGVSTNGSLLVVGGSGDNTNVGAVWVYQ